MGVNRLPEAFVCLWTYNPLCTAAADSGPGWDLSECYGIDEDGYPVTPSKYADARSSPSYATWLNRKCWHRSGLVIYLCPSDADPDDYHWDPIPGHEVTVWTFESGVSLAGFNPPEDADWLDPSFKHELLKSPNWCAFVAGGRDVYSGTARAAHLMLADFTSLRSQT